MYVLSIDSSTKKLGVAVSRNDRLLAEITSDSGMNHMVNIMEMLDGVLSKSRLSLKEIDVFGVNSGPGDFTGTRIGISVIKILSWLEGKPAYGINTLDVIALGTGIKNSSFVEKTLKKNSSVMVMPCMDVRRDEVYFAFYDITREQPESKKNGEDENNRYLARVGSGRTRYYIKKVGKNFLTHHDNLKNLLNELTNNEVLRIPGSPAEYAKPEILIGGNSYLSYGKTLLDIVKNSRIFSLDKKTAVPDTAWINICTYFNAIKKVETRNLTPVYVREFIPFGGGKKQES